MDTVINLGDGFRLSPLQLRSYGINNRLDIIEI